MGADNASSEGQVLRLSCPSVDATLAAAERVAQQLRGGEIIALYGCIGAGKTTFVRGLAFGLGVPHVVRSPSFTIVGRLVGRMVLFHVDLYRLEPPVDLEELGWREMLDAGGVVAVEWAEKAEEWLPSERLEVRIEYADRGRTITFADPAGRFSRLLADLEVLR